MVDVPNWRETADNTCSQVFSAHAKHHKTDFTVTLRILTSGRSPDSRDSACVHTPSKAAVQAPPRSASGAVLTARRKAAVAAVSPMSNTRWRRAARRGRQAAAEGDNSSRAMSCCRDEKTVGGRHGSPQTTTRQFSTYLVLLYLHSPSSSRPTHRRPCTRSACVSTPRPSHAQHAANHVTAKRKPGRRIRETCN